MLSTVVAILLLAGCPMPFNYNGEGIAGNVQADPSSPGVTPSVSVSFVETDGRSGSLEHQGTLSAANDTQVTVSSSVEGATIYYTTDGSPLEDLNAAESATGAHTFDVSISEPGNNGSPTSTTLTIRAVAVGPGTRPSPEVHVTVTVDYDTYSVTYDLLDSGHATEAPVDDRLYKIGDEVTVAAAAPERPDFDFLEWNTASDGTGLSFSPGDTFVLGSDLPAENVTLYAQWVELYTVSYNANGGDSSFSDPSLYKEGDTVTISDMVPPRTGYDFTGWNTTPDGSGQSLAVGDSFVIGTDVPAADVTLYAQWEIRTYTVAYDANGGQGPVPGSATYQHGQTVTVDAVPTDPANDVLLRSGAGTGFAGWNSESQGSGDHYWPGDQFTVTSNITLYAQYQDYAADVTERGPGGGIVFYDVGDYSRGWRYLEVATETGSGSGDIRVWVSPWSPAVDDVFNSGSGAKPEATGIGNGEFNTRILHDYYGDAGGVPYTAGIARSYSSNGYQDWFVPSRSGMLEIASVSASLGLPNADFWSSTQTQVSSIQDAYKVNTGQEEYSFESKTSELNMVLIRRF